ncbi:MAG: sugar-binding transcriptional regulator [Bacillus sp. (in: firmicutes)]
MDKKELIKIAQMYYEQDMTQSQIAKELGIYRTTISRMLKAAREIGIVTITINYDHAETYSLEEKLKNKFSLQDVVVVPSSPDQPEHVKLKAMGQACAKILDKHVTDGDIVGFSWGSSLAAVVRELKEKELKNVTCVPMVGGPSGKLESKYHVNTICYQAAQKWHAESLMIDVPAIVEKKETKNDILVSNYFRDIATLWEQITVSIFGIGSAGITGRMTWAAFYGDEMNEELKQGKVAGDICSRFFDADGVQVRTSISERTITIPLETIKKTRLRIGVAESKEKMDGILGALNGGYMNVLVTTEETARLLLE